VGLYFNSRKYSSVTALYEKIGIGAFRSAPETLAQISVSFWAAGNATEARQVLETARALFPGNLLLETTEKNIRRNPSR